jgi:hypothetical protein
MFCISLSILDVVNKNNVNQYLPVKKTKNCNNVVVACTGRSGFNKYSPRETCGGTPARLCKTRYNTTAPMYGVSLTSGQPVTIVQKFPDLLQQVVFEVCE